MVSVATPNAKQGGVSLSGAGGDDAAVSSRDRGVKGPPNRGAVKGLRTPTGQEASEPSASGPRKATSEPVADDEARSDAGGDEEREASEARVDGDDAASVTYTDPSGPSDDEGDREVPITITTKLTPTLALVSSLAACSTLSGAFVLLHSQILSHVPAVCLCSQDAAAA